MVVIGNGSICVVVYQHARFICAKQFFESYDQTITNFISLTNENKNIKDDSNYSNYLQEPHDSDYDVTVDRDFFLGINKAIMYAAMI